MSCPGCGTHLHAADVKDSRQTRDGVRRRRQCAACGKKFTTYEISERDYLTKKRLKERLVETRSIAQAICINLERIAQDVPKIMEGPR